MNLPEPGLPADFDADAYVRRTDHCQHTPGAPKPPAFRYYMDLPGREIDAICRR